jgi:hypothetical protein
MKRNGSHQRDCTSSIEGERVEWRLALFTGGAYAMKCLYLVLALMLIGLARPALAQVQGGTVSGTVLDEQGAVLPGVAVTLQGLDAKRESRAAKELKINTVNLRVIFDLFNVLNANTALVRNDNIASPTFDALAQNLSPRIARIGLTVGF